MACMPALNWDLICTVCSSMMSCSTIGMVVAGDEAVCNLSIPLGDGGEKTIVANRCIHHNLRCTQQATH